MHNVVMTADGQPEVKLACRSTLPVLQLCLDQAKVRQAGMPVCRGRVLEKNVSVLRDTGCSSIVVKRSLVNDCNLTGNEHMAVLIDGIVRRFPIATTHVDTPYYTGNVEAMSMEQPIYDLIIGNKQNARSPQDPATEWKEKQEEYSLGTEMSEEVPAEEKEDLDAPGGMEVLDVMDVTSYEVSPAIVARAQTVKVVRPMKPLQVLCCIDMSLTTKDWLAEQQQDDSLTKCWKRVRGNQPPKCMKTQHYKERPAVQGIPKVQ